LLTDHRLNTGRFINVCLWFDGLPGNAIAPTEITSSRAAPMTLNHTTNDFGELGSTARFWAVGLLFVGLMIGAGWIADILLLAFAGLLIATLLLAISELVGRVLAVSHGWRVAISAFFLAGALAATGWILVPRLTHQAEQLRRDLPKSIAALKKDVEQYPWGRWATSHIRNPIEFVAGKQDVFSRMTGVVSGTLAGLGAIIVITFAGLYFAAQPTLYREGLLRLVPAGSRADARSVLLRMGHELRSWLVGQLIAVTFIGVVTWTGLWLMGVQLALTLAVLAAVLAFIPNFGPIIAAVPAVLLALLDGPTKALQVTGLYLAVQTVESYLITPLVQQRAVSLPPALTLFAQLAMGALMGGVGLALATPLTVVVLVAIRRLYIEEVTDVSQIATSDSDAHRSPVRSRSGA
jgi:predicted PurR-regulated permease PerM